MIYEVVDSSKYTSIGLADMDVNYRPDSIDFKFLFTHDPYYFDRHVQVYAPGARLDSYDGEVTYSLGDRFKISRVGSTIYYQKYDFGNSVWSTLYTASAYLPTGSQNLPELMVDCSMSKHGGVITDAKISCFSYVRLKDNLDGSYYKCTGGRLGLIVEEEYFVDDAVLNLKIYDKSRTVVYTNTGELISTGVKNYSIDLAAAGGFTNNEFYTVEVVTAKDRKRFVRIQYQD
ncbi:MAG: hypothetical protein CMI36_00450 [Owenweeksia sp.]|nr:hypothetical protein [Owenweeksia sp.]MBF97435.1 hypothetical protein [Owenweeksia sp.]